MSAIKLHKIKSEYRYGPWVCYLKMLKTIICIHLLLKNKWVSMVVEPLSCIHILISVTTYNDGNLSKVQNCINHTHHRWVMSPTTHYYSIHYTLYRYFICFNFVHFILNIQNKYIKLLLSLTIIVRKVQLYYIILNILIKTTSYRMND